MVVGKMVWIFALPDQVARAAEEIHASRVEKSKSVRPVMYVASGTAANEATAAVTIPHVGPQPLPSVRFKQFLVVHTGI
jgi:hypothetical protein